MPKYGLAPKEFDAIFKGMTKQRFRRILKASGMTQGKACRDLGIAQSTASRWPDDRVPPYAAAYALLMERLSESEREQARLEMMT